MPEQVLFEDKTELDCTDGTIRPNRPAERFDVFQDLKLIPCYEIQVSGLQESS